MIRLTRPPRWITKLYSSFTWRFFVEDKSLLFLTFDDGPDPDITPFVLDLLKEYNWKATFFCVGENIKKHPELFQRIKEEGHAIGNHTMKHENGKKTALSDYLSSAEAFNQLHPTKLFRPPYGSITAKQKRTLRKNYHLIFWSWLTYDFDLSFTNEEILSKTEKLVAGDIIVLHDNAKFRERNVELFPILFESIKKNGFRSEAISDSRLLPL